MSKPISEISAEMRSLAIAYKKHISSVFMLVDQSSARQHVRGTEFQVTRKIDGIMACAFYRDGEVTLVGSQGKDLSSAPCAQILGEAFKKAGFSSGTVVCELYAPVTVGRPRVGDALSAFSDAKKSHELRLAPFDLVDLDGEPAACENYAQEHARMSEIFTDEAVRPVEMRIAKSYGEVEEIYREWVEGEGAEGLVIHSDQAIVWKLKPRHTVDAAIIGYTVGDEGVRDMLFAFQDEDGAYHPVGSVGSGLSTSDRATILERLQKIEATSKFVETDSRGIAFKMVKPELMVELSIGEFVAEDSEGRPKYKPLIAFDSEKGWMPKGLVPGVSSTRAVFERIRDDKPLAVESISLKQVTDLCPLDTSNKTDEALAPSELLCRRVFQKTAAGKLMVQKFLVWKTNKDGDSRFPAYVYHYTDYSSGRKDPLKRDLRVSSSREQIMAFLEAEIAENVKKGWVEVEAASKAEKADVTANKAAEKAEKDAEKAAVKAAKDAEKAAAKDAKDAEKAADKDAKDAEKAADKAEKDAEKAAAKAEKDAEKAAKDAEKAADKAAKEAEKAADKAEKDAEKAAAKAAKETEKAAAKAAAQAEEKAADTVTALEATEADNAAETVSMRDKVICLSGTFTYGKKADVQAKIAEFGGKGVDNLTKATEIMLVGAKGSKAYAFDTYGSKYEKACQMNIPVYHESECDFDNGVIRVGKK